MIKYPELFRSISKSSQIRKFTAAILIIFLYFWTSGRPISIVSADLGRHLINGRLVFNFPEILTKNFYSYTHSDFPFFNHHWATGVIFNWIHSLLGWNGLWVFSYMLSAIAVVGMFWISSKDKPIKLPFAASVLAIPLVGARNDIRPEGISLFFCMLFYLILKIKGPTERSSFTLPFWKLAVLTSIMIIWANCHICFIFGFFLIGCFWLEISSVRSFSAHRSYLTCLILCLLATFINPAGPKLILQPFLIFENYGYGVAENQPIWDFFLFAPHPFNYLLPFFVCAFPLALGAIFTRKSLFKTTYSNWLPAVVFLILSVRAPRNFSFLGIFLIPFFSKILEELFIQGKSNFLTLNLCLFLPFASLISNTLFFKPEWYRPPQWGLADSGDKSIKFFKTLALEGPIFNNYDIGSFLDFYLFPSYKVFVDNRPEAYPESFFSKVLVPMQTSEKVWQEQLSKYQFGIIYYSWRDMGAWVKDFITRRLSDPEWALIYVDEEILIFIRNTLKNREIIQKWKISVKNT